MGEDLVHAAGRNLVLVCRMVVKACYWIGQGDSKMEIRVRLGIAQGTTDLSALWKSKDLNLKLKVSKGFGLEHCSVWM